MELVDLVLDTGPPKKPRGDYPVLKRLERGEADVLAVGLSDLRRRSPSQDWLASRLRPQPIAILSVAGVVPAEGVQGVFLLARPYYTKPDIGVARCGCKAGITPRNAVFICKFTIRASTKDPV